MQNLVIAQRITFLIKNLALLLLIACQSNDQDPYHKFREAKLKTPSNKEIPIKILFTGEEQAQGLSGVRPENFSMEEGVLFYYSEMGPRRFWMPDTYFDLDIIFFDADFKIIYADLDVPAHPGTNEAFEPIYRTPTISAQYVLEVKAKGPYREDFKQGHQFIFLARHSLKQIESGIRQNQ